ncbi:hypothetical protein [Halodesulfovibrio sp.]|uniref:hypothetical protein n=1 Tax=Halodesulfovibrio sp. TaxID=1912772 RepID=UPI0025BF461D|nr:hypothetical protein [Halodesulfovibrio sp.]
MPHMNEIGIVAMVLICIVGFALYSALIVLPCWIIAKRRSISPPWWQWLIPLWNMYIAFRIGKGSNKLISFSFLLLLAGIGGVALREQAQSFVIVGIFLLIVSFVIGIYVVYMWLKNMSVLAGRHPLFLPVVMLILPVVLALIGGVLIGQKVVSPEEVRGCENVISLISWVIFLIIALRTPREPLGNEEFVLGKE